MGGQVSFQDCVDEVIKEIKEFSDKWRDKLNGDRFKNFRLIEELTGVPPEKQFDIFIAKEISQIFTNDEEAEDSYFDLIMWAILKRAYMIYIRKWGRRRNED